MVQLKYLEFAGDGEQGTDQLLSLSDVLGRQTRGRYVEKGGGRLGCNGTGEHSLSVA